MATNTARWQAICDGVLNRTATLTEQDRLGAALASGPDAVEYALMTNGQKVAYAVAALRQHLIQLVKEAEGTAAMATARSEAAATVEADFGAAP